MSLCIQHGVCVCENVFMSTFRPTPVLWIHESHGCSRSAQTRSLKEKKIHCLPLPLSQSPSLSLPLSFYVVDVGLGLLWRMGLIINQRLRACPPNLRFTKRSENTIMPFAPETLAGTAAAAAAAITTRPKPSSGHHRNHSPEKHGIRGGGGWKQFAQRRRGNRREQGRGGRRCLRKGHSSGAWRSLSRPSFTVRTCYAGPPPGALITRTGPPCRRRNILAPWWGWRFDTASLLISPRYYSK